MNKKAAINHDDIINYFQFMNENDEPIYQVLDMFPIPIEIFAPDGTTVYMNYALMELAGVKDRSLAIGKYNLLKDPLSMDQPGCRDVVQKAFKGEKAIYREFSVPIEDLVERKLIEEKPFEKALMDLYLYPVLKDKKLIFVVCVFVVRNLYLGRPDVVKAREYLDSHWKGEFVPDELAKNVNMSIAPLYRLFKEHTGMTPGDYHRKVKVEHLKEKLADKDLTIKEAFAACGESSRGWVVKAFKKITGMSPRQYKDSLS